MCIFSVLPELAGKFIICFKWEILFVVLNAFSVSLYYPKYKCSRTENCKETSGSKSSCMFFVTEKNAFSFVFLIEC